MSARYDAVADFYEAGFPDAYDDDVSIALFDLIGSVAGLTVLDIACGHGRMSRELVRRGARVVGLDISRALLDKAQASEESDPLEIEYRHGDAASPRVLGNRVFDVVVCSMGLTDIDDVDGAISTIAHALKHGGIFVFSLLHPCFPGGDDTSGSWPTTKSYYDEEWWSADGGASSLRRRVGANHRMLSTYLNTLMRGGFTLDELRGRTHPRTGPRSTPTLQRVPSSSSPGSSEPDLDLSAATPDTAV